jgi:chaperone required for assembly of F1-ATPase
MAKRFYKAVSVVEDGDAFGIQLDARTLKTPGRILLNLPSRALAEAMAAEWDAQVEDIDPVTMPITRLINVAREQTPDRRDDLIAEAVRYAGTDLISYRAAEPRLLAEAQAKAWDTWRDWGAEQGVDLAVTTSLTAIDQPQASLDSVEAYAAKLDNLQLTLFVHLLAVYGSTVLAMAVMVGALDAGEGFDLSRVDAQYQIDQWGEDEEAAEITAALREETATLGALVKLIA